LIGHLYFKISNTNASVVVLNLIDFCASHYVIHMYV